MRRILVSVVAVSVAALSSVALSAGSASASTSKPSAPRSVKGTPGNGQAVVSWVKPESNGGGAIDAYEVITYLNESPRPINVFHSTATSQTIISLTNGRTYTFKVAAHNAAGWSRTSSESPPVLIGVPSAPRSPIAVPGNGQARVSWTAPAVSSGSAITQYRVTPLLGATTLPVRTFNSNALAQTITSLTNGKIYSFEVAARNARGWGPVSVETANVEIGVPVAPTGVTGVPGTSTVTLSWTAPTTNNGSAITGYLVVPYLGTAAQTEHTFNSTATTQVITGLTKGKAYGFRVSARNGRGLSPRSAESKAITPGAPIAPTGVTAVGASGQARVSWTAPSVTNGSPVGAYEVVPYRSGVGQAAHVFSSTAVSQIIRGLGHGIAYRFRVAAHNANGWGPLSVPSAPVTPS